MWSRSRTMQWWSAIFVMLFVGFFLCRLIDYLKHIMNSCAPPPHTHTSTYTHKHANRYMHVSIALPMRLKVRGLAQQDVLTATKIPLMYFFRGLSPNFSYHNSSTITATDSWHWRPASSNGEEEHPLSAIISRAPSFHYITYWSCGLRDKTLPMTTVISFMQVAIPNNGKTASVRKSTLDEETCQS